MTSYNKHILLKGDSGATGSTVKKNTAKGGLNGSNAIYKNLQIGKPVGKPSVSQAKITAAVRNVMREDGMID